MPTEQLSLLRARVRQALPPAVAERPAAERPVARVALEVSLAHLDRLFDYEVGATQAAAAVPGARVRVRFAGRDVTGFIVERAETSAHLSRLTRLRTVVSAEPVLTPEVVALARAVADRCAGTLADVLRLAVPPRHAREEARAVEATARPGRPTAPDGSALAHYRDGRTLLSSLAAGASPRAVWSAVPGSDAAHDWPEAIAAVVQATRAGGRGALVVAPDAGAVAIIDAALTRALGVGSHVALRADAGPTARYRSFLAVSRGDVRVVVGTRAAAFAPVADLGLVVCWDDGDDNLAEPRAPYPHARDVLLLRAQGVGSAPGCALLLGGHVVSPEGARLLATGWARPLRAARDVVRRTSPRTRTAADARDGDDPHAGGARIPRVAWEVLAAGLQRGPVLVQVPRAGYLPALSCGNCRAPARCLACTGPLALAGPDAVPTCRWCARPAPGWACPVCSGVAVRAVTVGVRRTAEELGRTFARVPVRQSSGSTLLSEVSDEPAIVVATPGGEPRVVGGYAAAVLLDGWAMLARPDLRAAQEALRRWSGAVALVRSSAHAGEVVVCADPSSPAVQALVRGDPFGAAARELADREQAGLPPAVRLAALTGALSDVSALLQLVVLPASARVLGPVAIDLDLSELAHVALPKQSPTPPETSSDRAAGGPPGRALIRVPVESAQELSRELRAAQARRSVARTGGPVRVQLDPVDLG